MEIRYLKGVGEKRAALLQKLGIHCVEDLLEFYPRDYVDYSKPYPVASAPFDTKCVVRAQVYEKHAPVRVKGGKLMARVMAGDETAGLVLTYFNSRYATQKLEVGRSYLFFGRVAGGFAQREMVNPTVVSPAEASATPFVPVYPQTEGLNSRSIQKCVRAAFEAIPHIEDPLPAWMVEKYRLCSKEQAVRSMHFPRSMAEVHAARRRLIYEELLVLQLGLLLLRGREAVRTGAQMQAVNFAPFWASLSFAPTGAQRRAVQEIARDMAGQSPMNRLLQGDVGSGKTLVAAAAVYMAARNGYQSVLMAPTEILASQHAATLADMLEPMGISVALLTAGVKGAARQSALDAIRTGAAQLVVGTHAVLGEGVQFARLGLAVTDEQHRFGVRQRAALADKADNPHLLVMSATPIPRTLGLLLFGDLDISVLDELPPGRTPVKTYAITGRKRADMYGFLARQLGAGRQAYIVCPLIEEGESDMQAASAYIDEVARPLLPGRRIGLLHGRMKGPEKAAVMQSFKAHELDVLVSTTVIEVGVDVPNATCIVIENAERYGLSALHQLRGRVGRGGGEAFCILISDHVTDSVKKRLSFLCHTTDGFEVAKFDLETRGPGDFFGSRQHGLPSLRVANLATDTRTLYAAQSEAQALLEQDPALQSEENAPLRAAAQRLFAEKTALN